MTPTKSERSGDPTPTSTSTGETAPPKRNELAEIRENCLAQLNAIAARAHQLSLQMSSDWTRDQQEALRSVQNRQQSLALDYMHKVRLAASQPGSAEDMAAYSQRCAEDFEVSRREALKSLEESSAKLRGVYDAGIADANRDWDAACSDFVAALRQQLAANTADAAHLAAVGGNLAWIASMMRKPSPSA